MSTTSRNCPLCSSESRGVFVRHEIPIVDCASCGHRFADLAPTWEQIETTYGDDYFNGGGAGYSNYLDEARLLRAAGNRYAKLVARFADPGTMLDVGCAAGFILKGFEEAGWKGHGVELNPTMARYGREQLGLDVFEGGLEAYPDGEKFDLIAMIQVMGHFRDPALTLKKAASLTRSGGHLLIETWRRDSVTARAWGKNWHEYSPPSVLHWFTKDGLKNAVENAGFTLVGSGRPSKWINAAHASSLIKYKVETLPLGRIVGKALDLIPERMNLPYPAEDLVWMMFQKN